MTMTVFSLTTYFHSPHITNLVPDGAFWRKQYMMWSLKSLANQVWDVQVYLGWGGDIFLDQYLLQRVLCIEYYIGWPFSLKKKIEISFCLFLSFWKKMENKIWSYETVIRTPKLTLYTRNTILVSVPSPSPVAVTRFYKHAAHHLRVKCCCVVLLQHSCKLHVSIFLFVCWFVLFYLSSSFSFQAK